MLRRMHGRNPVPPWMQAGPLQEAKVRLQAPRQRPEGHAAGRRVMAELSMALSRRGLAGLLRHGDRNSMRFSVESRVPFLTTDMVDLLLSMPEHYLISGHGETKHVFRAALRGIAPDDVLDRRDKIGFETPEKAWLLGMAPTVTEWVRADLNLPFFDQTKVIQEFERIVAGKKQFSWQVWRWVNFCRWFTHFN
jgi:asparagine synthase (glutamine-hydrolysing)